MIHKQKVKLEAAQLLRIAIDVAKGMLYLHQLHPQIIHRGIPIYNFGHSSIHRFEIYEHLN